MREIPLTDGKVALVDDEDYEWLSQWPWKFRTIGRGYAMRVEKSKWIMMHRVIMNAAKGELIGHRNGNTLDNRRVNLYRATRSTLGSQQRVHPGVHSRYRGVTWDRSNQRWRAQIKVQGKYKHLGYFTDEAAAAQAYDEAAARLFGPVAVTNVGHAGRDEHE